MTLWVQCKCRGAPASGMRRVNYQDHFRERLPLDNTASVGNLGMMKLTWIVALLTTSAFASDSAFHKTWKFAVSGDSRNCGDIVMPTIAKSALRLHPDFYVHLGDFRWGSHVDEDLVHDSTRARAPTEPEYNSLEWKDFIDQQLVPFGKTKVHLIIGNHELYGHTREEYLKVFRPWLEDSSTYYHWTRRGVDFIALDNASKDQFDAEQMNWYRKLLAQDEADPAIRAIVVGMHEALPDSISFGHSMSEPGTDVEVKSGREVYEKLLHARDHARKHVYILASHSHFFMDGTFNTPFWRNHGGVLPGWIVGTAGAMRYALPPEAKNANQAMTKVYGYMVGTVSADGSIAFDFKKLEKSDVPSTVVQRYGRETVDMCFDHNALDTTHYFFAK